MSGGTLHQFGTVQQVAAHGHDAARRRYLVTLAHPVTRLAELLDSLPGVSAVQADRARVTFEYGPTPDDAARVLAELVTRRVPVASFAPVAVNLEEAYLRAGIRQVD